MERRVHIIVLVNKIFVIDLESGQEIEDVTKIELKNTIAGGIEWNICYIKENHTELTRESVKIIRVDVYTENHV